VTSSVKHRLLVAGAASLWGMWSLCFRHAERLSSAPLSGATESLIVFACMGLMLAPFAWRTRDRKRRSRRAWTLLMLLGVIDGVNVLCFFSALQHTTVALAVLTHYLAPLLVALLAPLVVGERWRVRTFIALAISLGGVVLLLQPWTLRDDATSSLVGPALGATSAFFFAGTVLIAKMLGNDDTGPQEHHGRFSIYEIGAWPKAPACLVLVVAAALQGGSSALTVDVPVFALLLAGTIAFGTVPLVMFYVGLARTPASQASVLTLCEPLVAVIVGVVAWHEVPGPLALVGGALVLAGAGVIARSQEATTPNEISRTSRDETRDHAG
jgi:drug/metabolite transporter (DMT)-like permease